MEIGAVSTVLYAMVSAVQRYIGLHHKEILCKA